MEDSRPQNQPFLNGDFPPPIGQQQCSLIDHNLHKNGQSPGWNNNTIVDWPSNGGTDFRSRLIESHCILRSYLLGQLANVGKAALWWSTFGILAVSILNSDIALAATRGAFNLALLLTSPLAVATAELQSVSIRKLLMSTTIGRLTVWTILIPGVWILFGNYLGWITTLWTATILLMFLDGLQVAFSNAVDIDCGGLDSLASSYELPLTDFMRYRYTTIHQLVFDSSFILFTPPITIALVFLSVKQYVHKLNIPQYIIGPNESTFVLALGVAAIFGLLSLISLYFYQHGIPRKTQVLNASPRVGGMSWPSRNPDERPLDSEGRNLWEIYRSKIGEVADGFLIVLDDKILKWRLVLLATETALEDTMVSVVIPMTAINAVPILTNGGENRCIAALISVVVIAVGKLGGVIAGVYLASRWITNQGSKANSRLLFRLVAASSLSLLLLPYGFNVITQALQPSQLMPQTLNKPTFVTDAQTLDPSLFSIIASPPLPIGCAALLLGVFLFFVFSTAPKIGFASLIQNSVTSDETEAAKVFGFVGMFVTITDGLMIIGVNLIFSYMGRARFLSALTLVSVIYAIHGLMEWRFGLNLAHENEEEEDEEMS